MTGDSTMRRWPLWLLLPALAFGLAAGACRSDRTEPLASPCSTDEATAFLDANRQRYLAAIPFPLGTALERGLIARRAPPAKLRSSDVYDLTHEVFVPYEFGERLDADPFDAEAKEYLREVLSFLIHHSIAKRDGDLVAELVACLRYLRLVEESAYRQGLELLLATQHGDGSWGDLERARRHFGEHGREGMVRHTTLVVISALTSAFHEPWNPRRGC